MTKKYDKYRLTVETYKRARKAMAAGTPRAAVAENILSAMERLAKVNPERRDKLPYLQEARGMALSILRVRLRIADPGCPEHKGYERMLARARNAKYEARLKTRPDYPQIQEKRRAQARTGDAHRRASVPGYVEKQQAQAKAAAARRKAAREATPVLDANYKAAERARGKRRYAEKKAKQQAARNTQNVVIANGDDG